MAGHEPQPIRVCDVCERTILSGELTTDYLAGDGEEVTVCALCRERADAAGWIRADSPDARVRREPRRRRSAELRERMRGYAGRLRIELQRPGPEERSEPGEQAKPKKRPEPERRPEPEAAQPAAEPAPPPPPETPERRVRRAVEGFNASEQARVVAGLMRSLGEPRAAVREASADPPRVEVTVAWELSWYRWEVALDGGEASVREVGKGAEFSEVEGDVPAWNATVGTDGKLRWGEAS